jgi:hypothetical protein
VILDLKIDKDEVLRYLYHKNEPLEKNLDSLVDSLIKETTDISRPRFIYNIFETEKNNGIILKNTNLILEGKDIARHLEKSEKCAVLCATLGSEIEMKINYYSKTELLKSVIMDACASTLIEALCDNAEDIIKKEAEKSGYFITSRYSPGYGDFDISVQKALLNIIEAPKKIGVTVTSSFIMLPRKSVSAVIGFQTEKTEIGRNKCSSCNLKENCSFRKGNTYCGT